MTRLEQRRLGRAFTAVLCALGPCAAVQACDAASTAPESPGTDATTASDDVAAPLPDVATPTVDAPAEGSTITYDATYDFDGPSSCGAQIVVVDGGGPNDADADVETVCDYTFACGIPSGVAPRGCDIIAIDLDGAPLDAPSLRCRIVENQGCVADAYSPSESGSLTMECLDCLTGGGGRRTAGVAKPRIDDSADQARGAGGFLRAWRTQKPRRCSRSIAWPSSSRRARRPRRSSPPSRGRSATRRGTRA